jgi:hypothetical protein
MLPLLRRPPCCCVNRAMLLLLLLLLLAEPSEARLRFLNEVKAAVRASARRELVVFVHGYNVNFEACMKSAAQVGMECAALQVHKTPARYIEGCGCCS